MDSSRIPPCSFSHRILQELLTCTAPFFSRPALPFRTRILFVALRNSALFSFVLSRILAASSSPDLPLLSLRPSFCLFDHSRLHSHAQPLVTSLPVHLAMSLPSMHPALHSSLPCALLTFCVLDLLFCLSILFSLAGRPLHDWPPLLTFLVRDQCAPAVSSSDDTASFSADPALSRVTAAALGSAIPPGPRLSVHVTFF